MISKSHNRKKLLYATAAAVFIAVSFFAYRYCYSASSPLLSNVAKVRTPRIVDRNLSVEEALQMISQPMTERGDKIIVEYSPSDLAYRRVSIRQLDPCNGVLFLNALARNAHLKLRIVASDVLLIQEK